MKTKEEILGDKSLKYKCFFERTDPMRYAALDAMEEYANNWIDVGAEQKPKLGQKVLVIQNPLTTATKEPLFAVYNGKDFMPPSPDFEIGKSVWHDITHWMPLPNLPKIKETNEII